MEGGCKTLFSCGFQEKLPLFRQEIGEWCCGEDWGPWSSQGQSETPQRTGLSKTNGKKFGVSRLLSLHFVVCQHSHIP